MLKKKSSAEMGVEGDQGGPSRAPAAFNSVCGVFEHRHCIPLYMSGRRELNMGALADGLVCNTRV